MTLFVGAHGETPRARFVSAACGVISLALLTGCAITTPTPTPLVNTVNASTPLPEQSASALPPTAVPHDGAQPSASPEVGAEAITLATDAVTAFCRPTLDRQTWIDGLYPYLSQTAAVAYETVNPARVPCVAVTGGARVRDGDGAYTVRVIVPTDAGEYSVYIHRPDVSDPWLVEQITPLAAE